MFNYLKKLETFELVSDQIQSEIEFNHKNNIHFESLN